MLYDYKREKGRSQREGLGIKSHKIVSKYKIS